MLIDDVINYCDKEFKDNYNRCVCDNCNHPNSCRENGKCKSCLEEIHFPNSYPNGKRDYDCSNLMNYYVCNYTYKYSSEILYLLEKSEFIPQMDHYNVLSIGCGASPDLMALEKYCIDNNIDNKISYIGIDLNELWIPIHNHICTYSNDRIKKVQYKYNDAIDCISRNPIPECNVLILQYMISHLYITHRAREINTLYNILVENIVSKKNGKFVVILNDVNSNNRGRDSFEILFNKLIYAGFKCKCKKFYFDHHIQNDYQRYGNVHINKRIKYNIPDHIRWYEPWQNCSGAQMIIEIE